jgi:uncharacterized membrane protein
MNILFTLQFFKTALVSAIIFIFLDLLWLSVLARRIYLNQLCYLSEIRNNRVKFILPVGFLAQCIISLGLAAMITVSLQLDNRLMVSVPFGGFCGFVIYATYDLTNLSFVKNWPIPITIIDIAWGTAQGVFAGFYVFYLLAAF